MTMSNTRNHWMLVSLVALCVALPWWSAVAQETPAKPEVVEEEAAEEVAGDDAPPVRGKPTRQKNAFHSPSRHPRARPLCIRDLNPYGKRG